MSIPEFLAAINGIAQLWAADRQFLGVLSSDNNLAINQTLFILRQ